MRWARRADLPRPVRPPRTRHTARWGCTARPGPTMLSMTSVSVCHSPVSRSWTRLRERNDRSAATARYSGSSSNRTRPPTSWMRSLLDCRNRCSWSAASLTKEARSMPASMAISPRMPGRGSVIVISSQGSGAGCGRWCGCVGAWRGRCRVGRRVRRSAPGSGMELQVGSHPLAQEHGVVSLEHPLTGPMPDGP